MLPYFNPPMPLGGGSYGQVKKFTNALWGDYTVKMAKRGAKKEDVDKEAHNLAIFTHPNVIRYFGRLEYGNGGHTMGIITEWMQSDLSGFMQM